MQDEESQYRVIGEHSHVTNSLVSDRGVLVLDLFSARPEDPVRVAYADGEWLIVEEFRVVPDDPDQERLNLAEMGFTTELPPVVPGREEPNMSDAARVHLAMEVLCSCANLRCPTVLNPSTVEERERVRRRGWKLTRNNPGPPEQAEPRRQCTWVRGHDRERYPCEWKEGQWPYGPAQHHPWCPRHPDVYNQPVREDHPADAPDRITLADTQTVVPVESHVSASAPVIARHSMPEQLTATATMARPFVENIGNQERTDPDGMGYSRDNAGSTPEYVGPYDLAAREAWKICAAPGPPHEMPALRCDKRHPHNPAEGHQMTLGSGDVIRW